MKYFHNYFSYSLFFFFNESRPGLFSGWQFRRLRRNSRPRENCQMLRPPLSQTSASGRCQVPKRGYPKSEPEGPAHFGACPGPSAPRPARRGLALLPHREPSALTMAARLWLLPRSAANQRRVAPRAPSAAAIISGRGLPGALPARPCPESGAERAAPSHGPGLAAQPGPAPRRPRRGPAPEGPQVLQWPATLLASRRTRGRPPAGLRRPRCCQPRLCGPSPSSPPGAGFPACARAVGGLARR